MNSRERELAAIRHETPDRIPVDAIAIENVAAIAAALKIAENAVPERLGVDGRLVLPAYKYPEVDCPVGEHEFEIEERVTYTLKTSQAGCSSVNQWGTSDEDVYGGDREFPMQDVMSVGDVEAYAWPKAENYDYQSCGEFVSEFGQTYALRGPHWTPLFCRVSDLLGMEEAMLKMAMEPEIIEAMLEQIANHEYEKCKRLMAACGDGMPILCLGDDFAGQRGMLMSPQQWRRFIKPHLARLFELGKSAGKYIWFHSCGDITAVLPDLIDIGMDVWETVQLHTLPMSARKLKQEYGKEITFFGGISTQGLPFARPGEIAEEVTRCIEDLAKGGGYICGPDHHIKPDVPAENALALFDTAVGFRREGYTLGLSM